MQKSLRQDLSIRIGLVIFCISTVIGVSYYFFSVRLSDKEFYTHIENHSKSIVNTFTLQLWLFDLNTARSLCELLLADEEISGLRLYDHKKNVICSRGPSPKETTVPIKKPLRYEGKKLVGYIEIYYYNTSRIEQKKNILTIGICIVLGTILGSFLFINILLKRHLSRPLDNLRKDMELLSQGDFQQSSLVGQKTEIQNIIDAFNSLTMHLQLRDQEIAKKTAALEKEVSERKRAEMLLRRSEEQWVRTFNSMSDIVTILDQDMVICQANKATFQFLNLDRDGVIGKHCYKLFRGADRACANCPVLLTLGDNKTHSANILHENIGKIFHLTSSPVLDAEGIFSSIVYIAKDITERTNLEEQLRQSHKMEALGTLAGGIAHDFNNILAAVLGYADMAMDDIPAHSPAKYQIEQVLKASNRAKELVKHILSFSRKEHNARVPLDATRIVQDALKFLRASIPATIVITEHFEGPHGTILADATQLHQVIVNLCTNSAQAMEENGGVLEVTVTTKEFSEDDLTKVPNLKPAPYVRLCIKDNGIGIEPKYLDKIFDPYFTTKEVGKGSGMGLAVVSGIVKSHDGAITVDSKPGEGTVFNVYFPKIEQQIVEEIEECEPLPTGDERILVVDDEETIVDMTRKRLEKLGYQVTMKTSSAEVLELFRANPDAVDLVISDQTMPGLTGDQLAKELLAIRADIPIIICSGYSSQIDAEKAKTIGIRTFLMKPVDKRELANTIRKVLDGK